MTGWRLNRRHWRWEYADGRGRVLYWISTEAAGTEFDSPGGFIAQTGERIPPLPQEAYRHGGDDQPVPAR